MSSSSAQGPLSLEDPANDDMELDENMAPFFQSLGLKSAQMEAALQCCKNHQILTIADLKVVVSDPEDLRELFPQLGIRSRVKNG